MGFKYPVGLCSSVILIFDSAYVLTCSALFSIICNIFNLGKVCSSICCSAIIYYGVYETNVIITDI